MARKRSDTTGSASIDVEIDKVLNEFAEGLTASDDHVRHQAIAHVLAVTMYDLRGRVADRLVDLLASKDREVRQRASASLVQLGKTVVVALLRRLLKTQNEAVRDQLIEILVRIAWALAAAAVEDVRLKMDLLGAVTMAAWSRLCYLLSRKRLTEMMKDDPN